MNHALVAAGLNIKTAVDDVSRRLKITNQNFPPNQGKNHNGRAGTVSGR